MKIHFFGDTGHGWAAIKRSLLVELGVEKKISSHSFQKGKVVYVEEGIDLHVFIKAMNDFSRSFEFVDHHSREYSRIRDYQAFTPDKSGSTKFYLLSILTRCGEFEFSQPTTTALPPEVTIGERTKDIVRNWYGDGEEDLNDYDDDGVAWFNNGNAVSCDGCEEITQSEYETFQRYFI